MIKDRITINISGAIFETRKATLNRFPETLLGNECKRLSYFCIKTNEYFFNRNKHAFEAILFFYQSNGDLRIPNDIKMDLFVRECYFYGIPKRHIDLMKYKAGISNAMDEKKTANGNKNIDVFCSDFQRRVWDLLENPESSELARILALTSILLILLSVILACAETIPSLKNDAPFWENSLAITELALNCCFLVEVTARFIFCPAKCSFMNNFLNIVDVVGVLPYFVIFVVNRDKMTSLSFLRILRFFRVLRLFRLSKHSARIKTVGIILKDSIKDLYIFGVCLLIMTVFSGAILYFAEMHDEGETKFTSIPESMWWALQTVVTIGYGDIVPRTLFGKFYSAFFMVFGALTIALPVLSIVMKFTSMYSLHHDVE